LAISYNTGATNVATAVAHTFQPTLVIPAGVLSGDVMLVAVSMFTFTPTSPGITLTPAVGSWTAVPPGLKDSGPFSGLNIYGAVWSRTATGSDAGTTLTFAFTGTPGSTDQFWWAIGLVAYTGAGGIDVSAGASGLNDDTTPSASTGVSGDWAVYGGAIGVNSGGTVTAGPAGTTLRTNANTAGVTCAIADTGASVGAAGTSIGGGSFADTSGGFGDWWDDFTIGLAPPGGGSTVSLTLAQEAVAAPAPSLNESLALAVAQESVSAPAPTLSLNLPNALAQVAIGAPAPAPGLQLGLPVAQEAVSAFAPSIQLQSTLGLAHLSIAARPLVISGGNLPPIGEHAGGSVSQNQPGGSVVQSQHGGSVTSNTLGGTVS
jgi:hypothetical protein